MGSTLRIDILADVTAADGRRVGRVDRVVMDPRTLKVTHIVIHKGLFLTRDIVAPVEAVRSTNEGAVFLRVDSAELDMMPDFIDEEFVVPPHAAPIGPYVPGSVLWPTAYAYAPVIMSEERHVPEETIEILEGTDVLCADGKIGTVDEVLVDSATRRISGFIVRRGFLLTHDVTVPVDWVKRADSQVVELTCTKEQIEGLDEEQRIA